MKKKISIKVNINCQICKTEVLKTATKLTGIDEISVDAEKETLTVIGEVDPVCVVDRLRKIGKTANIISVVEVKPKTEAEKAKEKEKEKEKEKLPAPYWPPLPSSCNECHLVAVGYSDSRVCSIM